MLNHLSTTLQAWLFPSQHLQQQALQWWHQRQCDRLHHSAELIREGVLQDLFALRRQLEMAHYQNQSVSSNHLQQLETLHSRLKDLGHDLSQIFSQDSLPLAIQGVLLQWRSPQRQIEWTMDSSTAAWDIARLNHASQQEGEPPLGLGLIPTPDETIHPILVTVLEEWLGLVVAKLSTDAVIRVTLSSQHNHGSLALQLQEPDNNRRRDITHTQELSYLCRAFEVLTDGKTNQHHNDTLLEWQFLWSLQGTNPPSRSTMPLHKKHRPTSSI